MADDGELFCARGTTDGMFLSTAERERQKRVVRDADEFAKFHFKTSVLLQCCSFLAFACMLAVEWIAGLRAASAQWVLDISQLGKDVLLYDEDLTSSARILSLTGDLSWRDRYNMKIAPLDDALAGIADAAPDIAAEFNAKTVVANTKLIDMEAEAISLSVTNTSQAVELLFGSTYQENKASLAAGLKVLDEAIKQTKTAYDQTQSWWGILSVFLVVMAFVADVAVTVGTVRLDVRLERKVAEAQEETTKCSMLTRERFLSQMQQAARSSLHMVSDTQFALKSSPAGASSAQISRMMKRIACLGIFADIIGIIAVGIPSTLTVIALVNSDAAGSLHQISMHMRSIEYYDLALTSSARICVLQGDDAWSDRYDSLVAPLDQEFNALKVLEPDLVASFVSKTSTANDALIRLEGEALALRKTNSSEAKAILFGETYASNKKILLEALADLRAKVDEKLLNHERSTESFEVLSRILMILCSLAVVGSDILRVLLAAWQGQVADSGDSGEDIERQVMDKMSVLLKMCFQEIDYVKGAGKVSSYVCRDTGVKISCV
eukprot:TRINITY_DN72225_c0_g1_i1.p1 TRINITY_DN72225_c0_g1~~TRINITY_DN72225_c0_g1_i1.p1  ORF type:complete len:551 (+),score=103.56 TRINITY_DN72225_c0_g1_i1:31-1683(+)